MLIYFRHLLFNKIRLIFLYIELQIYLMLIRDILSTYVIYSVIYKIMVQKKI